MSIKSILTNEFYLTIICLLIMVTILVFIFLESDLKNKFFKLGPGTKTTDIVSFGGIEIDDWNRVLQVYFISFLSGIFIFLTTKLIIDNIEKVVIFDKKSPKLNKIQLISIVLILPLLIFFELYLEVLVFTTNQFQYILFSLLGFSIMFYIYYFLNITKVKYNK